MVPSKSTFHSLPEHQSAVVRENVIEYGFIGTLQRLKYEYRPDISDRAKLEQNFREKFEALNRVNLTEGEFARLLDEIITPDVFAAAKLLRQINAFKGGDNKPSPEVDQVDFKFVLFASAVIDYDYIMGLISRFSQQKPGKQKMTREQLIGLIQSDAKFIDEREDIAEYISKLKAGEGLSETATRDGYSRFKAEKDAAELATIAARHHLATAALQTFVDGILQRMIFDGEQLSDLMAPLDLGWKARTQAELALMADLHPLLTKRAQGRDISGLSAYES